MWRTAQLNCFNLRSRLTNVKFAVVKWSKHGGTVIFIPGGVTCCDITVYNNVEKTLDQGAGIHPILDMPTPMSSESMEACLNLYAIALDLPLLLLVLLASLTHSKNCLTCDHPPYVWMHVSCGRLNRLGGSHIQKHRRNFYCCGRQGG